MDAIITLAPWGDTVLPTLTISLPALQEILSNETSLIAAEDVDLLIGAFSSYAAANGASHNEAIAAFDQVANEAATERALEDTNDVRQET